MNATRAAKFAPQGKKRILALDGGGIRGIATVEILAAIESQLRTLTGRSDLVLADYFDLVAGTSTGAIIATCLSLGMTVDQVRTFYRDSGAAMFDRAGLLRQYWYKFKDEPLVEKLKSVLGADTTFGSDRLRTALIVVMRNASTDSPWTFSNHPDARYNASSRDDCNLKLPLWQLVRASTAAPSYFPPEIVQVGAHEFMFVDGGVTTYNNPAFLAFTMATLAPYAFRWPCGRDDMLIVSIGTGTTPEVTAGTSAPGLISIASGTPGALMNAASAQQDLLCRMFGDTRVGPPIDREVGDLVGARGPVDPKLFTYLRYAFDLTPAALAALGLGHLDAARMQDLAAVDAMDDLSVVGRRIGERVDSAHYLPFL
jgi:patatin-like phospholipase/acyl hydrolase